MIIKKLIKIVNLIWVSVLFAILTVLVTIPVNVCAFVYHLLAILLKRTVCLFNHKWVIMERSKLCKRCHKVVFNNV